MTVTVRELIEHLQTLPQDFPVIYVCCSDYAALSAEDISVQRSTDPLEYGSAVNHHNMPGEYRRYGGLWEHKGLPPPTPADAVIFPGN